MANIGVLCPAATGHINPMLSISAQLRRLGHNVYFYQLLDFQEVIEKNGFIYRAIGKETFPLGRWNGLLIEAGKLTGLDLLKHSIMWLSEKNLVSIKESPALMKQDKIDLILSDEIGFEGCTISEFLKIPYVTLSAALIMKPDPTIPPFFTSWKYNSSFFSQARNMLAYLFAFFMRKEVYTKTNNQRKKMGLSPINFFSKTSSDILHISQLVEEFDFPRKYKIPSLNYVGPLVKLSEISQVTFPFERLSERHLIYASFGSVMGQQSNLFECIAEACVDLNVDLVISTGGAEITPFLKKLPGNPIVVKYAPQIEILKRSRICITHSGLNTVLESLSCGVPLIGVPFGNDQKGIASRIDRAQVGKIIDIKKLNSIQIKQIIIEELSSNKLLEKSKYFQKKIISSGGSQKAADLIIRVVNSISIKMT